MIRNLAPLSLLAIAVPATGMAQTPSPAPPSASTPPKTVPASSDKSATDLGYLTADQLQRKCKQSDTSSSAYCFAYIAAVTDTARAYEIWLDAKEFCLPAGISQAETRRAFLTYLTVYPAQTSGQAASVVVNALKQTYPCG